MNGKCSVLLSDGVAQKADDDFSSLEAGRNVEERKQPAWFREPAEGNDDEQNQAKQSKETLAFMMGGGNL